MDNVEIVQKVMAVDVAFGTFVAILQVYPQENPALASIGRPRRFVGGAMGRMGRAATYYLDSIVLRPINGAVAMTVARARAAGKRVGVVK
jgi:hypothetical protein